MKRREFLAVAAVAAMVPMATLAGGVVAYAPGDAKKALADGKTVFLDFSATWCPTCQAQGRVIDALRASDPKYDENITFLRVDWDTYGDGDLSRALKIPRRSTLVVLKGNAELGRIVAGTSKADIKALMDTALAAAAS